jgi:integrase
MKGTTMYKLAPSLPPEFARTNASGADATPHLGGIDAPRKRVLNEGIQRSMRGWARRKDQALGSRLVKRCVRLAAKCRDSADPRQLREYNEWSSPRDSRVFGIMLELLLETDCTLHELWAMRWSDVELTPEGLQILIPGRGHTLKVEDGFFDGLPQLSAWVFEGPSWKSVERAWDSICKKLCLPEETFA